MIDSYWYRWVDDLEEMRKEKLIEKIKEYYVASHQKTPRSVDKSEQYKDWLDWYKLE